MMRHNDIKTAFIATSLCFFSAYSANALEMKEIGNFKIEDGEGYAEMLRYHAQSKSLMVTASETGTLERLSSIGANRRGRQLRCRHIRR